MQRLFIFFFIILFSFSAKAQHTVVTTTDSNYIVNDIIVSGNKKTNTNIILREMLFKKGDTLKASALSKVIEYTQHQIFNTALFWEVDIHTSKLANNQLTVLIVVKERWYVFPLPYFRLVDRNFNEWWVNQNHSLERVDYGIKFYHNNLSGNNDKLTAEYITGYSRQISVRYNIPYINKKMTNGINVGFVYSKQKELAINTTVNNKQQLVKAVNGFLRDFYRADITFTNRPSLFARHSFKAAYTSENVDDFIAFANPNYYGNYQTNIKYFDLSYNYSYIRTNYNPYPTKGKSLNVNIYSRMFSGENNLFMISALGIKNKSFTPKLYMQNRVGITIKTPSNISYINQQLFGYSPYQLRGLEYYVVDGTIGVMHKFTLGYELFNFNIKVPIKNKFIQQVPFKIYPKIYNDLGYCYMQNATSYLNNKLLHTYGFGIDILTAYDIVFKFEYSFNQLGNSGLYFGQRD